MIYKVFALVALVLALLLTAGTSQVEGTLKGAAIGGTLAVSVGGRTVALAARCYRPNRTYYFLSVR